MSPDEEIKIVRAILDAYVVNHLDAVPFNRLDDVALQIVNVLNEKGYL